MMMICVDHSASNEGLADFIRCGKEGHFSRECPDGGGGGGGRGGGGRGGGGRGGRGGRVFLISLFLIK